MADNFDFTEGSGKTGSADDVGGVLYPRVKLDIGTDGVGTPVLGGAGAVAAGVPRVTLASDDPAVALLGTIDTDTGVIAGDTTSIDGKITACDTGAVVLATGSAAIGKLAANSGVDIGDVDVTSVPAPLNVVGGGTEAAALRVTIANNSTGLVSVDDGGGALTVDNGGTFAVQSTLQTGSNAIGKLAANSGVDIGDVDVTSIVPGVAATNLGKAEDAGHSSGDVGVAAMTVRANTATSLSGSDNDYQPLITDTNGRLHVLDANSGGILTALQILDDWDESDRAKVNPIVGQAGVQGAEGTITALTQRVTLATDDDAVTSLGIIDDWDAVHASAASSDGPQIMGAGYSTGLPADVGADGDAARICTDRYGRIVRGIMPQWFNAIFDSANASAEGNTVKAKTASRKIYILSVTISVDAEMWVKLQDEDSNAIGCKHWFKAGGGKTITYPPEAPLVLNVANKDLEVITEGAGNIGVEITGYLAV